MRKQVALALAAALSLSVAGTALAAPANPFVDVPANHWAYDAVKDLSKDGVISGYGDGTFRGDRTLTRYEMAAMIAKITDVDGKHEGLIKKLQAEFATELYNLGVRVDALEKNASTIKFTGNARIRYQPNNGLVLREGADRGSSRIQNRVRLNAVADINENTKFIGRIKWESNSNSHGRNVYTDNSDTRNMYFDRAEFAWKKGDFGISAGRMLPMIGQGLIWSEERADGFLLKYTPGNFTVAAGYLDLATVFDGNTGKDAKGGNSVNAFVAHLGYNFNDRANLTAGYLDTTSTTNRAYTGSSDIGYKLWSLGTTVKFGKDWAVTGEYVKNQDAPDRTKDKAYALRAKYGTSNFKKVGSYHVYVEYLNFGDASILGQGINTFGPGPAEYGVTGGFLGSTGLGMKGWGIGTEYVFAKNVNVALIYHKLKTNYDGYWGSNEKYKDMYTVATNFMF